VDQVQTSVQESVIYYEEVAGMAVYVGLLKGINVGKSRRIKMDDLRRAMESLGLKNVETYIQSGNFIFEAEREEKVLLRRIEDGIEAEFGFAAAVVLRREDELEIIIEGCPFNADEIKSAEQANEEGESMYVALLAEVPGRETAEKLELLRTESDDFRIKGREVYMLLRHSIRNSKMAAKLQRIEETSTVRNWKTMEKLGEMARKRGKK
jgi:uncharacterized protein (DUF1697 family)